MATKPSAIVRWGTDETNEVTPTSGQMDTGIEVGEAANSARMNYLLRFLGLWTAYLNDGALTGAHTFGSTVGVTGLITATAGLTAAANQHVTVSGTGRHKHGNIPMVIPCAMAAMSNASYGFGGGIIVMSSAAGDTDFPVMLPVGKRIRSVSALVNGAGTGTKELTFYKTTAAGSFSNAVIGTPDTSTSSGIQTMSIPAIDHVVLADTAYTIRFEAGDANDEIAWAQVVYDEP